MPDAIRAPRTRRCRETFRLRLLTGASAAALLCGPPSLSAAAHSAYPSLAQALGLAAGKSATAAASLPSAQAASAAAESGVQALLKGAARFRSLQQSLAAQALQVDPPGELPAVQTGIIPGGLLPAPGATPGSFLWQNASQPVAMTKGGRTLVTVQQTAPNAVLNWSNFNVSDTTTLSFAQGASSWVVLNRIVDDPTASPSQILGSVRAPGQVYVINQNGVIFGRGATVNVNALIASTADISTQSFLQAGIYSPNDTTAAFTETTKSAAGITVEAGATITTAAPASVTDGGGFVLLLGNSVSNAGSINTPGGQVALAAGQNFILRQGFGGASDPNDDPKATVVGVELAIASGGGTAINAGILQARDGDITMVGQTVQQDGAIISSTGIGQRGTVHLLTDLADRRGSVTLGAGSVTEILPDNSNARAIQSLRSSASGTSTVALNDDAGLRDARDLSRLEISSGGDVNVGTGAMALLPGGQIAIEAKGSVFAQGGSVLSVAGLDGVNVPLAANLFPVSIEPYELRDSPVNRATGNLNSASVLVDARTLLFVPPENGDPVARYYTGGGLLEVSGELGNVGYTIAQYLTQGGTITVSSSALVAQTGSVFDIVGGTTNYSAGFVPQTYLLATNGEIVNLSKATDALAYSGVYKGEVFSQARWNTSETYSSPLITPQSLYESANVVGAPAGMLQISAPSVAFSGAIRGGVTAGPLQNSQATPGETALLASQTVVPQAGTLLLAPVLNGEFDSAITITANGTDIADRLTPGRRLDHNLLDKVGFAASTLDQSGLGTITLVTDGNITVRAPLSVAEGGQIGLYAPNVRVAASLTARGGGITISDTYVPPGGVPEYLVAATGKPGIIVGGNVTLDTRGVWSNARFDPLQLAAEAWINGGSVTLNSFGYVTLDTGSVIDVSSGAFVSALSALTPGAGGSVALVAGGNTGSGATPQDALNLGASIAGYGAYGAHGGGTLTIEAPAISLAPVASPYSGRSGLVLTPELFQLGFAAYDIVSDTNLTVAPGTQIIVTQPVYYPLPDAALSPGGNAPQYPFRLELPPLFMPNPEQRQLVRRAGASLSLTAGGQISSTVTTTRLNGDLTIGQGAGITVDPGQGVILSGTGTETVLGTITARGGTIEVLENTFAEIVGTAQLWIGPEARLDVSGLAATAEDARGAPYGTVSAGGTIWLGALPGAPGAETVGASTLPIIVQPGAVLDAGGASATVALPTATLDGLAPTPVLVEQSSAGGFIGLASSSGIFIGGTLEAPAGGAGAAGGMLSLALETQIYSQQSIGQPEYRPYLRPRVLVVSQSSPDSLPGGTQPGAERTPVGEAQISADAIAAGGFGVLSLYARDAIAFAGDVTLKLPEAVILRTAGLADESRFGQVTLAAPYVEFYGPNPLQLQEFQVAPYLGALYGDQHGAGQTGSTLTIDAGLIDIRGITGVGSTGQTAGPAPVTVELPGFGTVNLNSGGDIRFLPASTPTTGTQTVFANTASGFDTPGNLSATASQIYPVTGADGTLSAGYLLNNVGQITGETKYATLSIARLPGPVPQPPLSALGALDLAAPIILQGGILRAPFGEISLGNYLYNDVTKLTLSTSRVTLLPGSVTSVSAAALDIPYGGTVDGQTYLYDGLPVAFEYPGGSFGGTTYGVAITGAAVSIDRGAILDLSGGGTLSGAGFISGRGGSTDTLSSPLIAFNPPKGTVSAPVLGAGDQVFALVPSLGDSPAPVAAADLDAARYAGSVPGIGETVTIGAGVPGLPAGTYALLPAYYAQLPGAFRIELRGASPTSGPQVLAQPDGSFIVAAETGIAGTSVLDPLPIEAILTPAATVQTYSQYDTQSYASVAVGQAPVSLFGALRPHLPQDASQLALNFVQPLPGVPSLDNQGTTELAPAQGGYGADVSVTTPYAGASISLVIGTAATPVGRNEAVVRAADLDAFGADDLEIGGYLSVSGGSGAATAADVAISQNVTIAAGAVLKAPTVVIDSQGNLTIASGATIDTRGPPGNVLDSSSGLLFNEETPDAESPSVLAIGNGIIRFEPSGIGGSQAVIDVSSGATLYTDGTIAAATLGSVVISPQAVLGAKILDLAVSTVNVGDPAIIAQSEPTGLVLSQSVLSALLGGNAAKGIPALQELDLTALQSLNFFGDASLNTIDPATGQSLLKSFVLNTPAIFGAGTAGDTASLTVGTLYWNDAIAVTYAGGAQVAVPQSIPFAAAGGPGAGQGALNIQAQSLIFGYGPTDVPYTVQSQRGIFGFSDVRLTATQELEGTGTGSLIVYQTQGPVLADAGGSRAFTGSGGNLSISTPLLTGGSGSTFSLTAGGALSMTSPGGRVSSPDQAGASLSLTGQTIGLAGNVILPSGLLSLNATGNIDLAPDAIIDVAGQTKSIFDKTVTEPGGIVDLVSGAGSVFEQPGAAIAIGGAPGQPGGTLSVSAVAGTVVLDGALATGGPDAAASGAISIDALTLPGFAALNQALTASGLFGARNFEIRSGGLTVETTDELRAHSVAIAVDNGALTVDGLIDATGPIVGTITLAGQTLTLTQNAVLDARGAGLVVDSYGQLIDSTNRAEIGLTASTGMLSITQGAVIELGADRLPLGDLELNAPRNAAVPGDILVDAPGPSPLSVSGAATIALNGFAILFPTGGTMTQSYFDTVVNPQNIAFENAALANQALQTRIAGLTAFGDAFHLRPGVILESAAGSNGNLTVLGDIDLAAYRYGPDATGNGAGEPGVLVLRAANDLVIAGSISDGFAAAPATPDDTGWVRFPADPYLQPVILSTTATLAAGTTFAPDDGALGYSLRLAGGAAVNPGIILPVAVTLQDSVTLPQAWVTPGRIVLKDGAVIAAGSTLPAGTVLKRGTMLEAGGALPVSFTIGAVTWPAGANLSAFVSGTVLTTFGNTVLQPGDTIPGDVVVNLPPSLLRQGFFDTRPDGAGSIVPLGVMLPAGTMSWTLDLVSGANTGGASLLAVQPVASIAALNNGTGSGALILDDVHYGNPPAFIRCNNVSFGCSNNGTDTLLPSVIRTGTGGLSLSAGGSVEQLSPYGIYTAGTQSPPVLDAAGQNPYEAPPIDPRGLGDLPLYQAAVSAQLAAGLQPYYPTDGGNVAISAQQDIATFTGPTDGGGWQFARGGNGVPASWSINFGSYTENSLGTYYNPNRTNPPPLSAPVGFGALGGGNVTITAGGDAGTVFAAGGALPDGLNVIIGSTGRVTSVTTSGSTVTGGTLVETGGGNITIDVAGTLNPNVTSASLTNASNSILADARGTITVMAGAVGALEPISGTAPGDPRVIYDPANAETTQYSGGLVLELGDGSASITARGAVVLTTATLQAPNLDLGSFTIDPTANFTFVGTLPTRGTATVTQTGFWLGQPDTSVSLLSDGGNVSPFGGSGTVLYPPILSASAPYGSLYFTAPIGANTAELAPSPVSALTLLAGNSIYGQQGQGQPEIEMSGAAYSLDGLANPFRPLVTVISAQNVQSNATIPVLPDFLLFAFEPDTPNGATHSPTAMPETIYAGAGDIVNLGLDGTFGAYNSEAYVLTTWYQGTVPVDIKAARDIVGLGGLVVNDAANDVSSIIAGRDIIYANLQVAGPGDLLLHAGRNVYQAGQGTLTSLGLLPVDPAAGTASRSGGAGITVLAGVGSGPDDTAFAEAYFNDANQANPNFLLSDPQNKGHVLQTYGAALLHWLRVNEGYMGNEQGALPAFLALPTPVQASFILPIYFDELRLSGREETDPASRFYKSYARGQLAIATLFPGHYQGDITLYGGSGIQTDFGGDITVVAPGGATTLGIESEAAPPASAGLITFGQGNVNIYAQGSVELGQSRVFTTFGGGITIWSNAGDINAGRGAKSTVVAQPFELDYSLYGAVTLSPVAPTDGAGIATLSEIPGTLPGDVDLIAPAGTIDAGEAGIRASGNANLAARIIVNAANIQVGGKTTGIPTFVSTSTAAEAAASAASGAAIQAAASAPRAAPAPEPSEIEVEILSVTN